MTQEPTTEPISEDDKTPATKGDLNKVETSLRTEIEGVDERLIGVEKDVKEIKTTVKRVLDIVTSIDKQNKELKDLPQKVAQHTDAIHKLKVKS